MTEDIVARLRADALWFSNVPKHNKVHINADKVPRFAAKLLEAADEIERLRAEANQMKSHSMADTVFLERAAHMLLEVLRADYKLYGVEDPFHATDRHPQRKQEDTTNDEHR